MDNVPDNEPEKNRKKKKPKQALLRWNIKKSLTAQHNAETVRIVQFVVLSAVNFLCDETQIRTTRVKVSLFREFWILIWINL